MKKVVRGIVAITGLILSFIGAYYLFITINTKLLLPYVDWKNLILDPYKFTIDGTKFLVIGFLSIVPLILFFMFEIYLLNWIFGEESEGDK